MVTVLGRPRAAVSALLLTVVLLAAGPLAPASAHAQLLASSPVDGATVPAVPPLVALTFSDPITQEFVRTSLATPAGTSAPPVTVAGPVVSVPVPQSGPGRYTLTYRVVSADGHPVSGTLTFTVVATATAGPVSSASSASSASSGTPQATATVADAGPSSPSSPSSRRVVPWLAVGVGGVVGLVVLFGALVLWIVAGRRRTS